MFSTLDDDEVEALLDGRALADDSQLEDLVAVAHRLRSSAHREPVPVMSGALRAQIQRPVVVALPPSRAAERSLRRGLAAAAAAAVMALVGVGAQQNRLPVGVQDAVSSMAEAVGVDLPRADERHTEGDDGSSDEPGDSTSGTDTTADDRRKGPEAEGGATGNAFGDGTTPGGATPADPGEPADKAPAAPATTIPGQIAGGEAVAPRSSLAEPETPTPSDGTGSGADAGAGSEAPAADASAGPRAGDGRRADDDTPATTAPGRAKGV